MRDAQLPDNYERNIRETQREESAALCEKSAVLRGRATDFSATQERLRFDFSWLRTRVEALLGDGWGRRAAPQQLESPSR